LSVSVEIVCTPSQLTVRGAVMIGPKVARSPTMPGTPPGVQLEAVDHVPLLFKFHVASIVPLTRRKISPRPAPGYCPSKPVPGPKSTRYRFPELSSPNDTR
jgi:hypothetical protein